MAHSIAQESGGTVVPLEKNADILIADHARKDAPPGSYSWKLIEDSVKHGVAQLKDRYAIGPDPVKPRPVASGGPSRSGRTEFTAEDDASLVRWVLSYNKHRTGNIIYQQLEQEVSRRLLARSQTQALCELPCLALVTNET